MDTCRFAVRDPEHTCRRNTGDPSKPGELCFYEAHAQVREQARDGFCDECGHYGVFDPRPGVTHRGEVLRLCIPCGADIDDAAVGTLYAEYAADAQWAERHRGCTHEAGECVDGVQFQLLPTDGSF